MAGRHAHLRGLATAIHEISGLGKLPSLGHVDNVSHNCRVSSWKVVRIHRWWGYQCALWHVKRRVLLMNGTD